MAWDSVRVHIGETDEADPRVLSYVIDIETDGNSVGTQIDFTLQDVQKQSLNALLVEEVSRLLRDALEAS